MRSSAVWGIRHIAELTAGHSILNVEAKIWSRPFSKRVVISCYFVVSECLITMKTFVAITRVPLCDDRLMPEFRESIPLSTAHRLAAEVTRQVCSRVLAAEFTRSHLSYDINSWLLSSIKEPIK